jgi:hypothetical protein
VISVLTGNNRARAEVVTAVLLNIQDFKKSYTVSGKFAVLMFYPTTQHSVPKKT